jgi:hypothetical protein
VPALVDTHVAGARGWHGTLPALGWAHEDEVDGPGPDPRWPILWPSFFELRIVHKSISTRLPDWEILYTDQVGAY